MYAYYALQCCRLHHLLPMLGRIHPQPPRMRGGRLLPSYWEGSWNRRHGRGEYWAAWSIHGRVERSRRLLTTCGPVQLFRQRGATDLGNLRCQAADALDRRNRMDPESSDQLSDVGPSRDWFAPWSICREPVDTDEGATVLPHKPWQDIWGRHSFLVADGKQDQGLVVAVCLYAGLLGSMEILELLKKWEAKEVGRD